MAKKKKKPQQSSPNTSGTDALRKRIKESEFNVESLKSAIEELSQEFEQGEEPYWLEGATEALTKVLSDLVIPRDRRQLNDATLSQVLEYFSDNFEIDPEAAEAAAELKSAESTFWYEEGDPEHLEFARKHLIEALNSLVKLIESHKTQ